MNITDHRRLEICWSLSAALHIAGFAFYLVNHMQKEEKLTVISEVEFIEPEPLRSEEPRALAQPLQRAPKNVIEFLKMALPIKAPPSLQDEIKAPERHKELMDAPEEKIDLKKGFEKLDQPTLDLSKRAQKSASLADAAELARASKAAPSLAEPELKLDEVGRARAPQAEFEALELKRGSRNTGLQEQALPTAPRAAPRDSGLQDASISLTKAGPSRSSSGELSNVPSIALGYSKGRGGTGIKETASLKAELPPPPAVKSSALAPIEVKKKGVELSGPISSRKILKSQLPEYPAWARDQGISADVILYFFVSPQGRVLDKIRVSRASGYSDLDKRAVEALKSWIFDPVSGTEEQWGYITFRFVLE